MLIFADDNCRVTKLKEDAEAPLLSTVDGVEYPSSDVPVRLIHGRATFKLKISQVSMSKNTYLKTPPMLLVGFTGTMADGSLDLLTKGGPLSNSG